MIYIFDLFGVAVFAISGALAAGKKQMDLVGVVVLALVTAIGGGTLRDLLLGAPVFWVANYEYLIIPIVAGLLTFLLCSVWKPPGPLLLVADAFGLAIFTVIGADKALAVGSPAVVAIIMGVMTGVVGGMIRDLLCGEIPLILQREIYATASLCGAVVLVVLRSLALGTDPSTFVAVIVVLALRLAAMWWKLSIPVFFVKR